jgi:hypothetical protein
MFIVFMAAGGITINAIIYPYYPLNSELMKRVFLRAFFGLFVTGWFFIRYSSTFFKIRAK